MMNMFTQLYTFAAACTTKPGAVDVCALPHVTADTGSPINAVLKIVFGLMGTIALLIIVMGGFKYITSGGEPDKINKAKDTIIYAAVGLAVSLAAFAIVTFVVTKV